jgi:hypothetical protein
VEGGLEGVFRSWPHSPQKRSSTPTSESQLGHMRESFVPHFVQNFLLASFSNWHLGQRIGAPQMSADRCGNSRQKTTEGHRSQRVKESGFMPFGLLEKASVADEPQVPMPTRQDGKGGADCSPFRVSEVNRI